MRNQTNQLSRPYAYADPDWQLAEFSVLSLAPFDQDQINAFVKHWCKAVRPAMAWDQVTCDERAQSLTEALEQRPDLADLASRPLLLTLMASLHSSWGRLPDDRADLYEASVKLLLSRWQTHRQVRDKDGRVISELGIAIDLKTTEQSLRFALEELAYQTHEQQGQQNKRNDEAADIGLGALMEVLAQHTPENLDPRRVASYLENRAGLLIGRREKVYAFLHRSFQEYLSACYLANNADNFVEGIVSLLHKDETWWQEVFLFGVGRMRRLGRRFAFDVVDELLPDEPQQIKRINIQHWRSAILAGDALLELRATASSKTKFERDAVNRTRDWLTQLIEGQQLNPRERLRAGNILGQLGDKRKGVGVIVDKVLGEMPDIDWCIVRASRSVMGEGDNVHELNLPTFYMSRFPVTNIQYRLFIERGGYDDQQWWTEQGWEWRQGGKIDLSEYAGDIRDTMKRYLAQRTQEYRYQPFFWHDRHWSASTRPVVGVTWYEAISYCYWLNDLLSKKKAS